MKVLVAYFSASGATARLAEVISGAMSEQGPEVETMDITPFDARQRFSLQGFDAVVFGFPVYANRAPRVMREWLSTLDGEGRRCATFFTYGGIEVHPAHLSTREILESRGFKLVSSAEFLARHTFNIAGWEALEDRPDRSDFDVAKEFAEKNLERLKETDPPVPGEFPAGKDYETLDQTEAGMKLVVKQFPSRQGEDCSMCMECEEQCPTRAICAETGEADTDKCILCLRCVYICPDEVLSVSDMSPLFHAVLSKNNESKESLSRKESRTYF